MHPVLIQIGNFFIPTYGVLIAFGLLLGTMVAINRGKKVGIDSNDILDMVFYCALAGIVGGRLLFVIIEYEMFLEDPFGILFSRSGFVFAGSIISAIGVGFWIARRRGLPIWSLADAIITAVPLAHVFGRIGCFMAGCCYGCVVNPEGFWGALGVRYPKMQQVGEQWVGSSAFSHHHNLTQRGLETPAGQLASDAASSLPVFPVQLLEATGNLLIFFFLLWVWKRRRFEGQIFVVYLAAYGILRFLDEFLRGDPGRGGLGGLSTSQIISLVSIGFAIALWKHLKRSRLIVETQKNNKEAAKEKAGK